MLEDLQSLLVLEPFVAFRIIMTSGNAYEVASPLQVTVMGLRLLYLFPRTDRRAYLGVIDVAAIETLLDDEHLAEASEKQ